MEYGAKHENDAVRQVEQTMVKQFHPVALATDELAEAVHVLMDKAHVVE